MNAKVTINWHSCQGITLDIIDGKLFWTVVKQKWKYIIPANSDDEVDEDELYDRFQFGKKQHQFNSSPVDVNHIEDFVGLLDIIFEFTGCAFLLPKIGSLKEKDKEDCFMKIESSDSNPPTPEQILDLIYQTPLEHPIRFVMADWCEKCQTALSYANHHFQDCQTYGEVMKRFNDIDRPALLKSGFEYYEYPDGVFLSVKRVTQADVQNERCVHSLPEDLPILDQNYIYVYDTYDR